MTTTVSHCPGATRHLAGTVGNRTHPSGFGDRLASLGTFAPKCPRWATSLRGARGPVPHERCDLSALIVGCIVRAADREGRGEKMKNTAPRYGAGGGRHK